MKKYTIIIRNFEGEAVACWFQCTVKDIKEYIKKYISKYTISIYSV